MESRWSTLCAVFLSATLLLSRPCLAAEEGEVFEFAPFVVRGGEQAVPEVPHPLSAVGAEAIQRGNRQVALDEALEGIPGVFVLNPHNFAQDTRIAIRGFGARADFGIRGIRLLVDGIPATSPDGQGTGGQANSSQWGTQ